LQHANHLVPKRDYYLDRSADLKSGPYRRHKADCTSNARCPVYFAHNGNQRRLATDAREANRCPLVPWKAAENCLACGQNTFPELLHRTIGDPGTVFVRCVYNQGNRSSARSTESYEHNRRSRRFSAWIDEHRGTAVRICVGAGATGYQQDLFRG
jgi:hypothetical protein